MPPKKIVFLLDNPKRYGYYITMMTNKKATVTVKRPNGDIETVATKHARITPRLFALMDEATRKAGRGELLGFTNPTIIALPLDIKCGECGASVDDTAYSQTETGYFAGSKVPVTAHYCADCERLLRAIGAGELTALEDRRMR